MPGVLLVGFRTGANGYTIVSATNPLPVTGDGGGSGATVTATAADPSYTEGQTTAALSSDLAGNLRTRTQGNVAHDAADAGNPVGMGARAYTAAPPAVSADGDRVALTATRRGALAIAVARADGSYVNPDDPAVVVQEAPSWVYIPASQTDTAGGNANDLLDCLLVIPATTSPGAVSVEDGAGTNYTLFAGGASSVSTLIPFPIDMRNIQATTGWEITTGAGVAVIAFYRPRT